MFTMRLLQSTTFPAAAVAAAAHTTTGLLGPWTILRELETWEVSRPD